MNKVVSIHEAKTHLSALLAEVERTGEKVIICRRQTPVADIVPHSERDRLDPHPVMRDIGLAYDPTEPLSEDEWPAGSST